ncbi:DUF4126 domain-containing protein [Nocardia sp. SC052]|uniref:DUF4126 domain-containing protein n=1 Tax=Nocardia sichangensis TaxID=3385975 RepID=UPI0039A0BE06
MSALPLIFTAGWASGVNAYAVVLLLGILGRFGFTDSVPDGLQRTDVLIAAAALFLIEAVADKIPYLDSFWDALHTVVRPIAGAVVAALLAGQDGSLPQLAAGAVGGTAALVSHLVKAGTRMAVNTSPEPASNIVVSTAEDVTVAGVVTLAVVPPSGGGGDRGGAARHRSGAGVFLREPDPSLSAPAPRPPGSARGQPSRSR